MVGNITHLFPSGFESCFPDSFKTYKSDNGDDIGLELIEGFNRKLKHKSLNLKLVWDSDKKATNQTSSCCCPFLILLHVVLYN